LAVAFKVVFAVTFFKTVAFVAVKAVAFYDTLALTSNEALTVKFAVAFTDALTEAMEVVALLVRLATAVTLTFLVAFEVTFCFLMVTLGLTTRAFGLGMLASFGGRIFCVSD
jgi:hypothetical protein